MTTSKNLCNQIKAIRQGMGGRGGGGGGGGGHLGTSCGRNIVYITL